MSSYKWQPPSYCQGTLSWELCSNGDYPVGAVLAGKDQDGGSIYVGRAFYEGDLLPAKVAPSHGCAFVSYGGKEVTRTEYEVLVSDSIAWKPSSGGDVPRQAIQVGYTADGEALYAGRTFHEGTIQAGKVHPSHGCLYIPFGDEEISFTDYEVLILI
ncbi:hypothetical protein O3M35_001825 [Rhynocoris fuscipes]|uniref:Natterin-3 n=1 Tax=Rhynocoris fuscipes TaxID=488301 RepID=A0AAW1CNU5_9HEMI